MTDLVLLLAVHLGICPMTAFVLGLEYGIPAEMLGTSRGHNVPFGPALEENGLLARSGRVGECAQGRCSRARETL